MSYRCLNQFSVDFRLVLCLDFPVFGLSYVLIAPCLDCPVFGLFYACPVFGLYYIWIFLCMECHMF